VRDSYGMTALNTAIDSRQRFGQKCNSRSMQRYRTCCSIASSGSCATSILKGLAEVVAHYRDGIAAVAAALDGALPEDAQIARAARRQELTGAGVPEEIAANISNLGPLTAAPDIVLVADRTGRRLATWRHLLRRKCVLRPRSHCRAASNIPIADYFDRLALDRARDSIGDAERRLTAAMIGNGRGRRRGRRALGRAAQAEVERIRGGSTKSPHPGLHCPSLRSRQAYWGIWSRIERAEGARKKDPKQIRAWGPCSRCLKT
jgi:glutamate dehydrogenase